MFSTYYHTVYGKGLYSPDGGLETLAHPGLCTFCLKRVNKLLLKKKILRYWHKLDSDPNLHTESQTGGLQTEFDSTGSCSIGKHQSHLHPISAFAILPISNNKNIELKETVETYLKYYLEDETNILQLLKLCQMKKVINI